MKENELKVNTNGEGTVIRIDFNPDYYNSSGEQTCFGRLKELAESFARKPKLSASMHLEDLGNGRIYIRALEDTFCPKWVAKIMADTALQILRESAG